MKRVVIGCLCAGVLGAIGCADGRGIPTSPSATAAASGVAATVPGTVASTVPPPLPRSGELHVRKNCDNYNFLAGGYCTIESSTLEAIDGATVVYAQAAGAASLDSDVVLHTTAPGNNTVFGHCHLEFSTFTGRCTFSGGTGKFTTFQAAADVSPLGGLNFAWDGTYSFSPRD
jgi:hypothetical protein